MCYRPLVNAGVAQLVRALPCHGRGYGFESRRSRNEKYTACYNFDMYNKGGQGERMYQSEASAEMSVEELRSRSEIESAITDLGHNLLNEHGMFDGHSGEKHKWLEDVQSSFIDEHGAALAIKEGDKVVGFVLSDHEGLITRFYSSQGKKRRSWIDAQRTER